MLDTITRYLSGSTLAERAKSALQAILNPIGDRYSSQCTQFAPMVVSGTATTAKMGSLAWQGIASGIPVSIAAAYDSMPVPTAGHTITAGSFNVACYFIDSASVITVLEGTEGATLAAVKFPPFPAGKALVGYLIITYASTFTWGTTALSTATTNYVCPVGAFDPSVRL